MQKKKQQNVAMVTLRILFKLFFVSNMCQHHGGRFLRDEIRGLAVELAQTLGVLTDVKTRQIFNLPIIQFS